MDDKTITKLEALSKLKLSADEKETLARELEEIIEYFDVLSGLDTRDVEPADTFGGLVNAVRSDEVKPSLSAAELTASAARSENGAFTVPRTVRRNKINQE